VSAAYGNPAHSLAMGGHQFSACFRIFCQSDRPWHASRFRRRRARRDPAFAKHAAFVIARSGAMMQSSLLWD